jgi:ABC-2 type transport system permease protein
MSRSLWFLVFLGVRARYRRILRGLATVKGFLLMLLGLAFIALIIIGPWASRYLPSYPRGPASEPLQRYGPAGLLAFASLFLFASTKHRGVYFSPAEVDFLFQAPLSRRELIAYRLATNLVHTAFSSLFVGAMLFNYLRSYWQTAAGLFLTFAFLNLLQTAASLLAGTLEERVVARGRRFIALVLVFFALLIFSATTAAIRGGAEFRDALREIVGSPAAGWALLPFKVFSETLSAPDLARFLPWAAGAVLVDLALLALVLRLDVDYTEASLETSRKIHRRLQDLRRGGRMVTSARKLRLPLPLPGRCGGFLPVAWRQAQELVRETPGSAFLLAIFAVGAFVPVAIFSEGEDLRARAGGAMGILVALPFILSGWFRFDFRGDLDRMELLLGLPVRPAMVALGQVLVPALILGCLQAAGLAGLIFLNPGQETVPARIFLLFCFPLNLLFVAIENLLFLLYPVRTAPSAPGDFQALGRALIAFFLKVVAFVLVAGLGFLTAYGAWATTGSKAAGALAGLAFLGFADAGMILLVGRAFARFDVSRSAIE